MNLKVYEYSKCGTCKKALKYLDNKEIPYTKIPIRETPPTISEIKLMLKEIKDPKKLFNTSGKDYKELNLKDKVQKMNEDEIIKLLNSNGNLIKRPFVLGKDICLIGFKEDEWKKLLF